MKKKRKREKPIPAKDFLSTGSTLLNLACSGKPNGGFYKKGIFLIVGDSDSGKTFLSMTCFAEAAINPQFKKYRFIHDNAEGGALMDFTEFFGKDVARRVEEPPNGISEYLEQFYFNLDELHNEGVPFIYVLDSMDALDTIAAAKKFQEHKKAAKKGTEATGSYGLDKPKMNSEGLRRAKHQLKKSKSIIIIISQTRDTIGFGAKFKPKTRSGGRALKFYVRLEIWSSIFKNLKKTVRGAPRQIGIIAKLKVVKNHLTGQKSECEVPIFNSYGMDDLGSCIDFLIKEKHWKASSKKDIGPETKVKAPEFKFKGTKRKLLKRIEKRGLETELQMIVAEIWDEIKELSKVDRKPRYE